MKFISTNIEVIPWTKKKLSDTMAYENTMVADAICTCGDKLFLDSNASTVSVFVSVVCEH